MPTTRHGLSAAVVKKLIAQYVAEAIAAYEANQNKQNGNGNQTRVNGGVRGVAPVAKVCTYKDFLNCQPRNFSGTEGFGTDIAGYTRRFQELTLMCPRMVPEEVDKIDRYIWGLPDKIHGNVTSSQSARLQDPIKMANRLMDQKIRVKAAKDDDSKRKWDDEQEGNHHQQQNKRQDLPKWIGLYVVG
ncbi:hypothetical protein Tco_0928212 [Tanacetum coccineum]